MEDYEKLGVFYLGRQYNLEQKQAQDHLILYDSKDLVTHAVCVGMTGSGKTGLCIGLIEEAAIDGVPAILIDPKGDLSNLLLTFPQLRGEDFLPWINLDDARQKNLSPQEFANQQAELWRSGLAKWGQSGERIQRLRDAADFRIYTPGSNAGFPVSILKSFASPGLRILEDDELLRERISTTVTSLLGLLGVEADPLQSREHILLSTILDTAWRQGQDLDLAALIQQVQSPPLAKIGVLDLETFYPAKDRFGLVLMLNNLLASPGFSAWMEGQPLDIGQILYTPAGKPRIAIFSIAHLSDAERMFFVSMLLNQVLGWMRAQSGTTSLRAILYMDEIFGYLPPLSNPPSKLPMLTLLKQGRAFGLGVVLATQNPVDLDYKGLSNTGTWFVGRLQTERDKARLLDGLEGAAATTGAQFDRQTMETILSGLGNRVFLMNNTHEDAPVLIQTRWALSYLRGPLSRDQIKTLMDPLKAAAPAAAAAAPATPAPVQEPANLPPAAPLVSTPGISAVAASPAATGPAVARPTSSGQPPALPPDISNFYIPARGRAPSGSRLLYRPVILGAARVTFSDAKAGVDTSQDLVYTTPVTSQVLAVDWANAQEAGVALSDLEKSGQPGAQYAELPAIAMQSRSYNTWSKDFTNWLYGNQRLEVLRSPSTGSVSNPGETERDFRIRLQQEARETRDEAVEKLRQKYAPKFNTLQERLRRAQQSVDREAAQAKQAEFQTAISFGATLLSAFTGRKAISSSSLGRATTAARGVSRSMEQRKDIDRAKDTVEAIQQQMKDLQSQFDGEIAALQSKTDPMTEELQTLVIKPKKTDISVQLLALVWAPYWVDSQGVASQAW
jgi:hypothetical protein